MNLHEFWAATLRQDAAAMREYFHPAAVIRWHCTNERFTLDEFIRANCEYPGEWDGEVQRVEQAGELIITAVHVYPKDRTASFHVVSFIKMQNDKVIALDEYWADDGEAPKWRREMGIGKKLT